MGSSVATMVISILGVCGFRISWIYTVFQIPEFHTLTSLYVSYPISWLAPFVVQVAVYFVLWHRRKVRDSLEAARTADVYKRQHLPAAKAAAVPAASPRAAQMGMTR